jgi:hypothetical protein
MAREFGIELVRSQIIANGAEYCDFRWKFPEEPGDAANGGTTVRP